MANKTPRICQLETPFEKDTQFSWQDYPRPQLKRDSYISLCGVWQLSVKKYKVKVKQYSRFAGFPANTRPMILNRQNWAE